MIMERCKVTLYTPVTLRETGERGVVVHVHPGGEAYEVELRYPSRVVTVSADEFKVY